MDHLHQIHQRAPRQSDLEQLAGLEGPVLSVYMNTHTHGKASALDGARFGRLMKGIDGQLLAAGHERKWVKDFLAPIDRMVSDDNFWQHQRSSIAVFRTAQESILFQLNEALDETISLDETAQLVPLVSQVRPVPPFLLLVLSKNEVRLFACDDAHAEQIVDDKIPLSFDDALRFEDPEAQLQFHSQGGISIAHGHGIGDEVQKERLDRFLLAVDRAIVARENNPPRPLVIAAVDHNVARYRQVSSYPALFPAHLPGNPDRKPVETLHQDAIALLNDHTDAIHAAEMDRIRALVGTGRLETSSDAIVEAARAGRIETLYVTQPSADESTINDAVVASLRNGGGIVYCPIPLLYGTGSFAVTRW